MARETEKLLERTNVGSAKAQPITIQLNKQTAKKPFLPITLIEEPEILDNEYLSELIS